MRSSTLRRAVAVIPLSLLLIGGILDASTSSTSTDPAIPADPSHDSDPPPTPSRLYLQARPLPIRPSVELTVCPEGPPVCQFAQIQEAIESAPETAPVTTWKTPPQLPLIRIAPGVYEEKLVILKNVWLQGAGQELVTLRQQGSSSGTIFIAGSDHLAIVLEGLTVEGPVQVVGSVSGTLFNNRFQPDTAGNGGVELNGILNLSLENNLFTHSGIYIVGALPLFQNRLGGFRGQEASIVIGGNAFIGNQHDDAIYVRNSEEILIDLNYIQGASAGVLLVYSERISIFGNLLESNWVGIFGCCGNREVIIVENRIERNRGEGLSLGAGGEYLVKGNRVLENGGAGIEWGPIVQLRILGNTVTGNRVGLRLSSRDVPKSLENLKECRDNRVFGNEVDYAGLISQPLDELRRRCEGS